MILAEPAITDVYEAPATGVADEVVASAPRHTGRVVSGIAALGIALSACGGEREATPTAVEVAAGNEQDNDEYGSPSPTTPTTLASATSMQQILAETQAANKSAETKLNVRGYEVQLARPEMAPQQVLDALAANYTAAQNYKNPSLRASDVASQVNEAMDIVDPQLSPAAAANGHRADIIAKLTKAHNYAFNDPFYESVTEYNLIDWRGSVASGYGEVTYDVIEEAGKPTVRKKSILTLGTITVQGKPTRAWQFDTTTVIARAA